jgi:hypothetical protein
MQDVVAHLVGTIGIISALNELPYRQGSLQMLIHCCHSRSTGPRCSNASLGPIESFA